MSMDLNDDDKSLIKDILNSPGWPLIEKMNEKAIAGYRQFATSRGTSREDREWYSALALGREEVLQDIREKVL